MAGNDQLLDEIMRDLRQSAQSVRRFDPGAVQAIEEFRAMGRKAGRVLGWKVRTFRLDPIPEGEKYVVVYVAVVESTPLHEELMRVRGEKALRKAFDRSFEL